MSADIIIELEKWLKERGYVLINNGMYRPNGYEVRFRKQDKPPDLGVHIIDGIGASDKVGG